MTDIFVDFLNAGISASYIIIAVILIRLVFKKIPRKFICVLWAIVGIRLVIPFSIESVFSLIPSAKTIPSNITVAETPAISSGISAVNDAVNPVIGKFFSPEVGESANPLQIAAFVAAIIWIAGMAAVLIYGIISTALLKKKVSASVLLCDNIRQSENVVSPFILGFFKPKIYIPFGMDEDTRKYVVEHENAHIRRHDHQIKPLGFAVLAVYWFNPLVWVAYILLCKDIEVACDEKVICQMNEGSRREYASALLECAVNRRRIAACPLAFGEVGLKERVKGIMNYKKPAFWIIVVAVISCVVAAVCFLTDPKSDESGYDLGYALYVTVEDYDASTSFIGGGTSKSYPVTQGTKGKLFGLKKFEIIETDLQTGCLTLKFNDDFEIGETVGRELEISLEENTGVVCDGKRVNFLFKELSNLDTAISKAITEKESNVLPGTFAAESHTVLATKEKDDLVTVYLMMHYGEFVLNSDGVLETGASAGPAAITFKTESGSYVLKEYWKAEDGKNHTNSIKEKFPLAAAYKAIKQNASIITALSLESQAKAEEYFALIGENNAASSDSDKLEVTLAESSFAPADSYVSLQWTNKTDKKIFVNSDTIIYRLSGREWEYCGDGIHFTTADYFDVEPHKTRTEKITLDYSLVSETDCIRIEFDYNFSEEIGLTQDMKGHIDVFTDNSVFENIGNQNTDEIRENTTAAVYSTVYTYNNSSGDLLLPKLTLNSDGSFDAFFSPLDSNVYAGSYILGDDFLILKCDDGETEYVFDVVQDGFSFNEEKSSALPKFKPSADSEPISPLPDGALFK